MQIRRVVLCLSACALFAVRAAADLDIRGAWHADTYILKDGTRHPVQGVIIFADRDWSVLFLVVPDGHTPMRGSAEAGTYTISSNRLVFSHRYNVSGGRAVEGIPESPLAFNLHDETSAPAEPCSVELSGERMVIHFPSGNAMTFVRAAASREGDTPSDRRQTAPPPITGQVTFLYFNDIDQAALFYGTTLGLAKTFDLGWVRIFALSPTSSVGLVDGKSGAHRPSAEKPVMVSLIVDDVDQWYEYLKARGVAIAEPPSDGTRVKVRSFVFRDPEGHTLEVFKWLDK